MLFTPLEEAGVELSNRAGLSSAISTIFALILGIIALIVAVMVSSSDYKAEQDVKKDTASLQSSLRSIMVKVAVLRTSKNSPINLDRELEVINDFLCSTTAFAYWSWVGNKHRKAAKGETENWRVFFLDLIYILDSKNNYENMAKYAIEIEGLLTSLSKKDINTISGYFSDLAGAFDDFDKSSETIIEAVREVFKPEDRNVTYNKLLHLKNKGITDPNIDLSLAVMDPSGSENVSAVKATLEAGADPNMTDMQLLDKYRNELEDFHPTD